MPTCSAYACALCCTRSVDHSLMRKREFRCRIFMLFWSTVPIQNKGKKDESEEHNPQEAADYDRLSRQWGKPGYFPETAKAIHVQKMPSVLWPSASQSATFPEWLSVRSSVRSSVHRAGAFARRETFLAVMVAIFGFVPRKLLQLPFLSLSSYSLFFFLSFFSFPFF